MIHVVNLAFVAQIARNFENIATTTIPDTWMTAEDGAAREWPDLSTAQSREKSWTLPVRITKKKEEPALLPDHRRSTPSPC